MVTTKQRSILRSHANKLDVILQVGKQGLTPTILKQLNDALTARELVKGKVLENSMLDARTVAQELSEGAECEIIQVIGSKFVLYKQNKKNPVYEI